MLDYLRAVLTAHLPNRDERGASAVEYGLLIAGIAAVVMTAVFLLGPVVAGMFTDVNGCLTTGAPADCD